MTDTPIDDPWGDDESDTEEHTRFTRRQALGALAVVGGGVFLSSVQFGGENPYESDELSPWEKANEIRQTTQQTEQLPVPTFNYEPVSETVEEQNVPIREIAAVPNEKGTGDRIEISVDNGFLNPLHDTLLLTWASSDSPMDREEITINGEVVMFRYYTGADIAFATGERVDPAQPDTLQLVRGQDESTVRELVDSYEALYDE